MPGRREKVAVIGSGNWGSAIARLAGLNAQKHSDLFDELRVPIWVFEEEVDGKKLTEIINETHINQKYLPGIKLPDNIVAVPNVVDAVKDATALVFVLPHQFLHGIIEQLKGNIRKDARAITLIKGVHVQGGDIHIFADLIERELGVSCSSLSGANIANEVAADRFSETTIGYRTLEEGEMWQKLFATDMFRVQIVDDVAGVSLCGALKNIVAVGAGFIDGLKWGDNAKAAIMRIGLLEMKHFCLEFFDNVKPETFLEESAGVADLITTCLGGRNRKCAEAFVTTGKPFDELEREMLNGQKLQGIHTAMEVHEFLEAKGRVDAYPLFDAIYRISWENADVTKITARL